MEDTNQIINQNNDLQETNMDDVREKRSRNFKLWYEKNKDYILNSTEKKEYRHKYYEENKHKIIEYQKQRYREKVIKEGKQLRSSSSEPNEDEKKRQRHEYYLKHKEEFLERNKKRRQEKGVEKKRQKEEFNMKKEELFNQVKTLLKEGKDIKIIVNENPTHTEN